MTPKQVKSMILKILKLEVKLCQKAIDKIETMDNPAKIYDIFDKATNRLEEEYNKMSRRLKETYHESDN